MPPTPRRASSLHLSTRTEPTRSCARRTMGSVSGILRFAHGARVAKLDFGALDLRLGALDRHLDLGELRGNGALLGLGRQDLRFEPRDAARHRGDSLGVDILFFG